MPSETRHDVVAELRDAITAHDPTRIAACFTEDYRCERPLHPGESFTGREQVQRNYTMMLEMFSDLHAEIPRTADNDREHCSEWEMSATALDGSRVLRCGPVILTTRDGLIDWARFYVDPVDEATDLRAFADGQGAGHPTGS